MKMVETEELKKETTKIHYNPSNIHSETGKPIKIRKIHTTLNLCMLPNGKIRYLSDEEYRIAKEVDKSVIEGHLSTVVSPASVNDLFKKQFYIAEEDPDLKFFAKMYYKQYWLDFEKFNKDQDARQKRRTLKSPFEGENDE